MSKRMVSDGYPSNPTHAEICKWWDEKGRLYRSTGSSKTSPRVAQPSTQPQHHPPNSRRRPNERANEAIQHRLSQTTASRSPAGRSHTQQAKWSCPRCTYLNFPKDAKCAMCGGQRYSPNFSFSQPRRSQAPSGPPVAPKHAPQYQGKSRYKHASPSISNQAAYGSPSGERYIPASLVQVYNQHKPSPNALALKYQQDTYLVGAGYDIIKYDLKGFKRGERKRKHWIWWITPTEHDPNGGKVNQNPSAYRPAKKFHRESWYNAPPGVKNLTDVIHVLQYNKARKKWTQTLREIYDATRRFAIGKSPTWSAWCYLRYTMFNMEFTTKGKKTYNAQDYYKLKFFVKLFLNCGYHTPMPGILNVVQQYPEFHQALQNLRKLMSVDPNWPKW